MPARRVVTPALLGGVLLAGCAHQPPRTTRAPESAPNPAPHHAQSVPRPDLAPPAETADNPPAPKPDYQPHDWPDPDTDLWSHIRAGFEFAPHANQRDVRAWTQYYATHRKHLRASCKRARPFLWYVVKQVDARDMPTEIALVPIIESGYNPSARSYVGASGLWQFMPGTADHMGLARDWWYDGRNDAIASTDAALDYLSRLHEHYHGDWFLALAAYNAGPNRVDAAIARMDAGGGEPSYWNLELPSETTEYVPKLLAVRRIMMTPARFGFDWPALGDTPRTRSVTLPGQTDLAIAARMLDMPKSALQRLNPDMRRWASAPGGDTKLLVPAGKAAKFEAKLAAADPNDLIARHTHTVRRGDALSRLAKHYGVSVAALRQANHLAGDRINIGQTLQIPRSGAPRPPAEPTQTYVVQAGDTFWGIAHRYKVGVATLRHANRRIAATLHPGQTLTIPGSATPPEPSTHVVKRGDSLWSIAHANDVAVADLRRWNRLGRNTALQPGRTLAVDGPAPLPDYYEVEAGDSLWSIANRFSMKVATLRSLNDMASNSTIRPGQRLRLQS